ncbi:MAG: response regulator [Candidatus Margulisiibacteriota bacterium]
MVSALVVDDELFVVVRLKNFLEDNHVDVVTAGSGEEAIELYRKNRPDIMFCDVVMGKLDGVSTMKKIREVDPSAFIVLITAMASQDVVREQAMSAGAVDVLGKPFDKARVLELVARCVQEKENQTHG